MTISKKTRGKGGLIGIKLDMKKDYDMVKWNLLLKILNCLGFS